MHTNNIKSYLIIAAFLVVLFFLVIILPFGPKEKETLPTNETTTAIPTSYPTKSSNLPASQFLSPSPTLIPPEADTGALEEQLPKEVADLATQKQELKKKLPVILSGFTITFDYAEDKFVVNLTVPKETSQKAFENWLKTNYPAIPNDRFLLK